MADTVPPTAAPGSTNELDVAAARRRSPAERKVSRTTGLMLLAIFFQAGFGYALVVPPNTWWSYEVHLGLGLLVAGLAVAAAIASRDLTVHGGRERFLRLALPALAVLVVVQFVLGYLTTSVAVPLDTRNAHIGLGMLVTFAIILVHIGAILPSLLVSARREHARSLQRLEGQERQGRP